MYFSTHDLNQHQKNFTQFFARPETLVNGGKLTAADVVLTRRPLVVVIRRRRLTDCRALLVGGDHW